MCATSACIYIANWAGGATGAGSVTVYVRDANGDVAPIQTVSGSNTGLNGPWGIAVDAGRNIYVANMGDRTPGWASVTVYAAGANGNVAPIQTISGPNTGLSYAGGLALDASRNIYVGNGGSPRSSVTVYAAGANGDVAPIRTIVGVKTGLYALGFIAGTERGVIFVANLDGGQGGGAHGSVTVYAPGANGDVAPTRTIRGKKTGLDMPWGITLDDRGNTFLANFAGGPSAVGSVTIYNERARGNVIPLRTISGSNTMLNKPTGIALDAKNDIYVAESGTRSLTIYAAGASGNVAPIRTIVGSSTGLVAPAGVAVR